MQIFIVASSIWLALMTDIFACAVYHDEQRFRFCKRSDSHAAYDKCTNICNILLLQLADVAHTNENR